ncbi:MAG: DUF1217 domain-containing protein [Pseudomonadota bacterium]
MPIAPALPLAGVAGLRFLDRTYDRQFETFLKSPDVEREITYFQENAADITSVDELMADRRILAVVLGAFGLDEDLNKGAFIRKVIEEGTLENDAFANRLVEPAYRELADTLGFGNFNGEGTLILSDVRANILQDYRERQFELAVGDVNIDMRFVLNFRREATEIVSTTADPRNAWLRLIGSPPLRQVVEGALSLPPEFAAIDIDQQVDEIIRRADSQLDISSPAELLDPAKLAQFVDRFVSNSQIAQGVIGTSVPGSAALTLLQSASIGPIGGANLFASNF